MDGASWGIGQNRSVEESEAASSTSSMTDSSSSYKVKKSGPRHRYLASRDRQKARVGRAWKNFGLKNFSSIRVHLSKQPTGVTNIFVVFLDKISGSFYSFCLVVGQVRTRFAHQGRWQNIDLSSSVTL